MGEFELREELRSYIFLRLLHDTAKSYIEQKQYDRMIAEGEADIQAGLIHNQDEMQKMIQDWTKE